MTIQPAIVRKLLAVSVLAVSQQLWAADPQSLTINAPQTMGMSMFRAHWDQPIPLAEGGATGAWDYKKSISTQGRGSYAVWTKEQRKGKPGALAFDGLNRSALVRFPDAAEKIAALINQGKKIDKVEIVLTFLDEELFPVGSQMDHPGPDAYDFKSTFNTFECWMAARPTWHAVAYALRKPWSADDEMGPTFNAAINGALYWKKYGAQDPEQDRVDKQLGPAEVSYKHPDGHLDVTITLNDPAFGKTLAERLRHFSDNGFLVRKWETYDHHYFNGVYESATATGGRAILTKTPQLVVTYSDGGHDKVGTLPPAVDVKALAAKVKGTPEGGVPTAVMPSEEQIQKWAESYAKKPAWADETQWKRIEELLSMRENEKLPFWSMFFMPHLLFDYRKTKWENGKQVIFKDASIADTYAIWVDSLIGRQTRGWRGFEVAREYAEWSAAREILPEPAKDAFRRYWSDWLRPEMENAPASRRRDPNYSKGPLVHPMVQNPGIAAGTVVPDPVKGVFDMYWEKTGDWRGNKSFYRSGFCYDISTQNFNTSASVGAFVFGNLLGADKAIADGRHGVNEWLSNGWIWSDGSGQEHFDHYYYAITLIGLKTLQNAASTPADRLLADGLLAKGMEEAIAAWHPNLKRFIAPAGRTSLEYLLGTQEGGNFMMNTLSKKSVLTDIGRTKLPGNIPVIGHDAPPALIGMLALQNPWADKDAAAMVDDKPLPWDVVHHGNGTWRRCYMGENYGLAAGLTGGTRIQGMAQWRREDKEVTSALDLGTLDIRMGLNETRWVNDAGGWIAQPFKQIIAQGKNRWLAVASPSGVSGRTDVKSIQYSLGLFDIRESGPTWEIYIRGKKVEQLPATAKQGEPIVIKDGVTYLGITPIPGTDLGRDAEVVIEKGQPQKYDQYGSTVGPAVVINSYLYKKAELMPKDSDHEKVRRAFAGYAVEFGDKKEYPSFEAFQSHIAQASVKVAFDEGKRELTASSTSGKDTMELKAVIAPPAGSDSKALAEFSPKVLSTTWNGEPLYANEAKDYIMRDTPVTQMAWDHAEKNGARVETSVGTGIRIFLQAFPEKGRYTAWNTQGRPTDFRYLLPGGGQIISDGLIGRARIQADLKTKTITIDHARDPGRASDPQYGAATAFLLTGLPAETKVVFNGKVCNTSSISLNGQTWRAVAIDDKIPVRSSSGMAANLELMHKARVAQQEAAAKQAFLHLDYAGPFPQADGAYGPEKTLNKPVTAKETYAGEGQAGATVKWMNRGKEKLPVFGLWGHSGSTVKSNYVSLFNAHRAESKGPCTYYLHAVAKAAVAQDVGVKLKVGSFPQCDPKSLTLWVNGQPYTFPEITGGLVKVPLKSGENEILLKVQQDEAREERSGDQIYLVLGDPVMGLPNLTNVQWKTVDGQWVPVNPKASDMPAESDATK